MRKRLIIIAMFLTIILLPLNAKALEANVTVKCNSNSIAPNGSMNCQVVVNTTSGLVSAADIKYASSENLLIENVVKGTKLTEGSVDEGRIQVYSDSEANGEVIVASFTLKAKETAEVGTTEKISLSDIVLTDENSDDVEIDDVNVNISIEKTKIEEQKPSNDNSTNVVKTTTNNKTTSVSNPKTADINVILILLAISVVAVIAGTCYKKMKKIQ